MEYKYFLVFRDFLRLRMEISELNLKCRNEEGVVIRGYFFYKGLDFKVDEVIIYLEFIVKWNGVGLSNFKRLLRIRRCFSLVWFF